MFLIERERLTFLVSVQCTALHFYSFDCIPLFNLSDIFLTFWLFFIQIVKPGRDACTCMPLIQ